MATVTPTVTHNAGIVKVFWEALATGDTVVPYRTKWTEGLLGSMQATGTLTNMALQGSNDGTNYTAISNSGTAIALTAAGSVEFNTAMKYIKPVPTATDADVTITLRG